MDVTWEKARDLGRLLGQMEEYKALERARNRVANEPEMAIRLNRLGELETQIARALQQGIEPAPETASEYERLFSEVQSRVEYQALVAAQANFDKILSRVNDEIGKGMAAGSQSRIILPS